MFALSMRTPNPSLLWVLGVIWAVVNGVTSCGRNLRNNNHSETRNWLKIQLDGQNSASVEIIAGVQPKGYSIHHINWCKIELLHLMKSAMPNSAHKAQGCLLVISQTGSCFSILSGAKSDHYIDANKSLSVFLVERKASSIKWKRGWSIMKVKKLLRSAAGSNWPWLKITIT